MSIIAYIALGISGVIAHIFGAVGDPSTEWVTYLLNGGPFALVVLLMITDKITTTGERDRLRLENIALRDEIKILNEGIRKDIVPPLVQINGLMKDVIEELSERRGRYYPPDEKGLR